MTRAAIECSRRKALRAGLACSLGVLAQSFTPHVASAADDPLATVLTFTTIPKSTSEVAAAHLKSQFQVVDFLPRGEPLEINSFTTNLTPRDRTDKSGKTKNPSTRRPIMSVGIEVGPEDKGNLPKLSASAILAYLNEHYVSLQARIQKDAASGTLYLHQRPIAATSKFGTVKLTEDFTPAVAQSVREMHSMGLYMPAKTPVKPENLRTLFMIHKHNAADDRGGSTPRYEFIIIRGRAGVANTGLDVHTFATTDDRQSLNYMKAQRAPGRFGDCSLKATVYFSRYTDGIVPAESVVRSQSLTTQATFSMPQLEGYVKHVLKKGGSFWENVNDVLDAIIDRKLRATPPKPAAVTSNDASK